MVAAELIQQNPQKKLGLLQIKITLSSTLNVGAYVATLGIPALTFATMFIPLVALLFMTGYHTVLALAYLLVRGEDPSRAKGGESPSSDIMLTVVIPVKNEPMELVIEAIERGLRSLGGPSPVEILVVSDDTEDYVENLLRRVRVYDVKIIRRRGVGGRSGALDIGFRLARGQYVMYLDIDAKIQLGTLDSLFRVLGKNDVVVVPWKGYCNKSTKLGESLVFMTTIYSILYYNARSALNLFVFPLGSGTVYRRKLLEVLGGWGPGIVQDDVWMGIKLASIGLRPKVLRGCYIDALVPSKYTSLRIQQCRWAYGTSEALSRGLRSVLSSPLRPVEKFEALIYLLQPAASIAMALTIILAVIAAVVDGGVGLETLISSPVAIGATAAGATLIALYSVSVTVLAQRLGYSSKWWVICMMGRAAAFYLTLVPLLALYSVLGFARVNMPYRVTPKASHEDLLGVDTYLLLLTIIALLLLGLAIVSGNIVSITVMATLLTACIYTILNHSREVPQENVASKPLLPTDTGASSR